MDLITTYRELINNTRAKINALKFLSLRPDITHPEIRSVSSTDQFIHVFCRHALRTTYHVENLLNELDKIMQ